jgi:hypothetical protein
MTDQTTGQPAATNRGAQIAAALFAGRDVMLSLAPYGLAVYSIWQAVQLNDASFTKGLVQGLFAAALLAINPRGPHKDGGQ